MISARQLLAFFCLVAVLVATLSPASAGLCWAILVPLLFVVGTVTVVWSERQVEETGIPELSCLSTIASRAPPPADPLG